MRRTVYRTWLVCLVLLIAAHDAGLALADQTADEIKRRVDAASDKTQLHCKMTVFVPVFGGGFPPEVYLSLSQSMRGVVMTNARPNAKASEFIVYLHGRRSKDERGRDVQEMVTFSPEKVEFGYTDRSDVFTVDRTTLRLVRSGVIPKRGRVEMNLQCSKLQRQF